MFSGWSEAAILKTVLMMMSVSMAICCVTARPGATDMDTIISFLAFLLLEVTPNVHNISSLTI